MQDTVSDGDGSSIEERLTYVVNQMLEPYGKSIPSPPTGSFLQAPYPIDVSKPNQHDNKPEFQRELAAVSNSLEALDKLLKALLGNSEKPETVETGKQLHPILDSKFRSNRTIGDVKNSIELLRRNIADVGGYAGSIFLMIDLKAALQLRFDELKDQEQKFWSVSHRPPDYHARAIALRLAKLLARETGQRPTYGTSGETGDPSTSYTRALRAFFEILGISTEVRTPATWAIGKISDSDLEFQHTRIIGGLLGYGSDTETEPDTDPELDKYVGQTPRPPLPPLPPIVPRKKPAS